MQEVKKEKWQISKAAALFDWYRYSIAAKEGRRVALIQLN